MTDERGDPRRRGAFEAGQRMGRQSAMLLGLPESDGSRSGRRLALLA